MATSPSRALVGAWSDRVLARLERWPLPLWATLGGGILVGIVAVHAIEWTFGELPFGRFELYRAAIPVYPFGILGLIAAQRHAALRALERFRPASGLDDGAYRAAAAGIRTQPAVVTLMLTLGFGLLGVWIEVTSADAARRLATVPVAHTVDLIAAFLGYMMTGPWLVAVVRLLVLVTRLHRRAPRVDLLDPEPVRAFSAATAVVGTSLMAIATLAFTTNPAIQGSDAGLALTAGIVVLAFASFITPLWGMHRRLLAERARLLTEAGTRLEATIQRVYAHVDEDRTGLGELRDRMSALTAARDLIAGQSTWPWRPETLRWLLSALVIPLLIWGITRALDTLVLSRG